MPLSGSLGYKDSILTNGGTVAPYNYAFSGGSDDFCVPFFVTKTLLKRLTFYCYSPPDALFHVECI